MWKVSVDFLQKHVRTVRGKLQEVSVFLWGGHAPPQYYNLYCLPPWGLYVPIFILLILCLFLRLCLCPARLFYGYRETLEQY